MQSKSDSTEVSTLAAARVRWQLRERRLSMWMYAAASRPWVVTLMTVVSRIGDGWTWFIVLAFLPWVGGTHGSSAAVRLFAVGCVDLVIYQIVKRWIARPRPFRVWDDVFEQVRPLDEYSFPSGHTLHAVACSVVLTVYYPMTAPLLWPLVVLIALSRVVLGLHYPSDVVAGAVIGGLVAGLSFRFL